MFRVRFIFCHLFQCQISCQKNPPKTNKRSVHAQMRLMLTRAHIMQMHVPPASVITELCGGYNTGMLSPGEIVWSELNNTMAPLFLCVCVGCMCENPPLSASHTHTHTHITVETDHTSASRAFVAPGVRSSSSHILTCLSEAGEEDALQSFLLAVQTGLTDITHAHTHTCSPGRSQLMAPCQTDVCERASSPACPPDVSPFTSTGPHTHTHAHTQRTSAGHLQHAKTRIVYILFSLFLSVAVTI